VIGKSGLKDESPISATLFNEPRRGPKLYYMFNNTGNVNTASFSCMLKQVADDWATESPGLRHYVWMDNLQCHCDPAAIQYALERHLFPLFLPKCTTHLFQPLDRYPFALLKNFVERQKRTLALTALISGEKLRATNEFAVQSAINYLATWLDAKAMKASFRDCGLYPFSSQKILELARANIGELQEPTLRSELDSAVLSLREILSPPKPIRAITVTVKKDVAYTGRQLVVSAHEREACSLLSDSTFPRSCMSVRRGRRRAPSSQW
jgi:hypothetical protein